MPLTKQYLTYSAECRYGVVTGRKGGAVLMRGGSGRRVVALSPALEDVKIWDPRTSNIVGELKGDGVEVGVVCVGGDECTLAVGREDGSIVMWDIVRQSTSLTLSGHKSAITCLQFNSTNTQLVSGSKDTNVIMWDIVSETGLYRLKGHKGAITDSRLMTSRNILITSSKDGLVKLWDLDTQHCFQTLVSHHREVWSLELVGGVTGDGNIFPRLVTVSEGTKLKVFQFSLEGSDERKVPLVATEMGNIKMASQEQLSLVRADKSGRYLACLCQSCGVELYIVQTGQELEQLLKKRKKKARKRATDGEVKDVVLSVKDEVKLMCSIKGTGKHRSVDLITRTSQELFVLLTMQNNSLELHSVLDGSPLQLYRITAPGHRTDIRTLCFSSDNSRILSASAKMVKVWNRSTQQCVCTLASRYALCSTFVPGDRYAIVGSKSGHLQLFDLASNSLLEDIPAHQGAVWGVSLFPDRRGVVSGGADHLVKFWEFELISGEKEGVGKKLTLIPTRTLKLSEDVLGVCHSPNGRLLAVSLLDSTIKMFFTDTLKFFLSLYGHKLPVLSMDISSDNALLVSCSADKNLRIWGLDYGDCHKSIFAHEESIMSVRFVPDTHLLFSASKDATIKCWDADNFQHILTLKGHHSEVWCLAISSDGDTVVSGSHDHSIRLWQRTQEPLVLSEQREIEREAFMDQLSGADTSEPVIPGEISGEVSLPSARSKDTLSVVDRLLESLSIWKEQENVTQFNKATGKELELPKPHPILVAMGNIKAEKYVLNVVKGIKSCELEECLLVMPFDQMVQFLQLAEYWLERGWEVELVCRCLFFLLRVHHPQLVSSHTLIPNLHSLLKHTSTQVNQLKDMYGFNLAGLHFIKRELENRGTSLFQDAPSLVRKKRKLTN